jgi:hypothetical protein
MEIYISKTEQFNYYVVNDPLPKIIGKPQTYEFSFVVTDTATKKSTCINSLDWVKQYYSEIGMIDLTEDVNDYCTATTWVVDSLGFFKQAVQILSYLGHVHSGLIIALKEDLAVSDGEWGMDDLWFLK